MREYELTYLISDNVPESELNKVTGKVGGYITGLDGKILKEEIWGRRKLAYPIKKQEFATYVTVNFNLPAEKAHEFERNIILTSKIVRHLLIVKDFGEEKLTLTADDIAKAEEIKEVIGSEKSFEAIEGETEESKDLMAIRGNEETSKIEEKIDETKIEEPKKTGEEKIEKEADGIKPVPTILKEDVGVPTKSIGKEKTEKLEKKVVKKSPKNKSAGQTPSGDSVGTSPLGGAGDEADRLSKLDKELDEILGEEL